MDTFKLVIGIKDIDDLERIDTKDFSGAYIALNLCKSVKSSLIQKDYESVLNHIRSNTEFKVLACIKDLDIKAAIKFIGENNLKAAALFGTYTSEYLRSLKNELTELELFVSQDPRACSFETFTSIYKDFCTGFIATAEPWCRNNYYFKDGDLNLSCKEKCIVSAQSTDSIDQLKKQGFGGAFIDFKNIQMN